MSAASAFASAAAASDPVKTSLVDPSPLSLSPSHCHASDLCVTHLLTSAADRYHGSYYTTVTTTTTTAATIGDHCVLADAADVRHPFGHAHWHAFDILCRILADYFRFKVVTSEEGAGEQKKPQRSVSVQGAANAKEAEAEVEDWTRRICGDGDGDACTSSRLLRFMHLLTPAGVSVTNNTSAAIVEVQHFRDFFTKVAEAVCAKPSLHNHPQLWNEADRALHVTLQYVREASHRALCDNFNVPEVMQLLHDLAHETNVYHMTSRGEYKTLLLSQIARYIDGMLRVFGVMADQELSIASFYIVPDKEKLYEDVVGAACTFHDALRDAALANKSPDELLRICDHFRDEQMPSLGVRIEDDVLSVSGDGSVHSVWKLDDPQRLKRERHEVLLSAAHQKLQKLRNKLDTVTLALRKSTEDAISPREFFVACLSASFDKDHKNRVVMYTAFDANGRPTHDAQHKEIAKSALKQIDKVWLAKDKAHQAHRAKLEKNPHMQVELETKYAELRVEIDKLELDMQAEARHSAFLFSE